MSQQHIFKVELTVVLCTTVIYIYHEMCDILTVAILWTSKSWSVSCSASASLQFPQDAIH